MRNYTQNLCSPWRLTLYKFQTISIFSLLSMFSEDPFLKLKFFFQWINESTLKYAEFMEILLRMLELIFLIFEFRKISYNIFQTFRMKPMKRVCRLPPGLTLSRLIKMKYSRAFAVHDAQILIYINSSTVLYPLTMWVT